MSAKSPQRLRRLVELPNLLSLDAPLVAVSWQWLLWYSFIYESVGGGSYGAGEQSFASGFSAAVHPPPHAMVLLFTSVWMIYTADRLFDCRRMDFTKQVPRRHRFAQRWRRPLWWTWAISLTVSIVIALLYIQPILWFSGLGLLVLVGIYTILVHADTSFRQRLPKEFFVGVIFALGTSLPTVLLAASWNLAICILLISGLFVINCLINARVQQTSDQQQEIGSAVGMFPGLGRALPWLALLEITLCQLTYTMRLIPGRPHLALMTSGVGLMLFSIWLGLCSGKQQHLDLGFMADYFLLSPLLLVSSSYEL